jgi:hypothetical protein
MLVSIRCLFWVNADSALAVVMLGRDLSLACAAPCINCSVTLLKVLLCGTLLLRPATHSCYLTSLSASLSLAEQAIWESWVLAACSACMHCTCCSG